MSSVKTDFSFCGGLICRLVHMDISCMCLVKLQTYHQRKGILYLSGHFMIMTSLEWNFILFENRTSTKPFLAYSGTGYVALYTDCIGAMVGRLNHSHTSINVETMASNKSKVCTLSQAMEVIII